MQAPNINALDGTIEERLRDAIAGKGERSFPIPVAFFVVDAGFLEYFTDFASFTSSLLQRIPLTSGSVEYQFQGKKQAPTYFPRQEGNAQPQPAHKCQPLNLFAQESGDRDTATKVVYGLRREKASMSRTQQETGYKQWLHSRSTRSHAFMATESPRPITMPAHRSPTSQAGVR